MISISSIMANIAVAFVLGILFVSWFCVDDEDDEYENQTGTVYYQELAPSFRVWTPQYITSIGSLMSLAEMTGKKVRVVGNKFDKKVENDN